MRSRGMWAFAAVLTLVFAGALPAMATAPVTLGSSRVLDDAGVLSLGDEETIVERAESLSDSAGLDLWVVYVDTFSDPADATDWGNSTARLNNLGVNQYLLAVATEGRAFYLSGDPNGPVSDDQLAAIEQERIGPALRDEGWVAGAEAAIDGLTAAKNGTGGASGSGGIGFGGILFVGLLVVVVGALIWFVIRARRSSQGGSESKGGNATKGGVAQLSLEELGRRAGSALVQTDDALKTSEQELGFARAQFGDEATTEFVAAIAQAKADLDEAFSLQQKLDDATPDTEQEIRTWNARIIELCAHANQQLDEKAAAFDELRKLEQNAPEALARVQELRTAAVQGADAAATRLRALQTEYAAAELAPVADNPAQATARLRFADEQLAAAQAAIGTGDGGAAAVGIRAAEEAVGQARLLHDAIGRLGDDLATADRDAAALVAELEADIASASAISDTDGRIAGVVAGTRQQVESARPLLTGSTRQPLTALERLEKANAEIDALLSGIRDAQEQQRRAAQQLTQLMTHAQAQVSAAEDFITSRRGAVGATARTRLAEAGASLVQARQLAASDATGALAAAQRANDLAAQALRQAQSDVGGFGGGFGGGGDVMGAVLGGILINSMLGGGGGRRSGGIGRSGPTLRAGRGGGMSSGSFGGGGTRSRRGGGRF